MFIGLQDRLVGSLRLVTFRDVVSGFYIYIFFAGAGARIGPVCRFLFSRFFVLFLFFAPAFFGTGVIEALG